MELPDPPEDWHLKFLSANDPPRVVGDPPANQWTAHLWSTFGYVYGYGTTARYAMLDAISKIEEGNWFERLSGGRTFSQAVDIVQLLEIKPVEKPKMDRRF